MPLSPRASVTLLLIPIAAVVFCPLMVPPILGLADNGDFSKVCLGWALEAPRENEYHYVSRVYQHVEEHRWVSGFWSSEHLLARAAIVLDNLLFERGPSFDIRALGLVHGAFFLAAIVILLDLCLRLPGWRAATLIAVLALILCDFSGTSFLNSFYMDVPAYVGALLAAALAIRLALRPSFPLALEASAALALLVSSKIQHSLLAVPLVVFLLWKGRHWWPKWGRALSVIAAFAVLAVAGKCFTTRTLGYQAVAIYDMAFFKFLPASKDVEADLRQLNLDDSHRRWIGTWAYQEGSPLGDQAFVQDLERRLPTTRIIWFLVTHPRMAFDILVEHLGIGGRQRQTNLGNFERVTGRDMQLSHHFTLWSDLKRRLFEFHGLRFLIYVLATGTALSMLLFRKRSMLPRGIPEAGWTLLAMTLLAMAIGCWGDALEVDRHLFLFNWLADLMLCSLIATSVATA